MASLLDERVEELRGDRTHGGSWMARRAVEALVALAEEEAASSEELLERLVAAGRELAASRPGVGAVAGAVGRLLATAHGQAHLPPTRSAIIMSMEPVFATFFAVLLGGELLTGRMLVGGALVLTAMLVVELVPRRRIETEVPHIAV